jgi:hypothetical protein
MSFSTIDLKWRPVPNDPLLASAAPNGQIVLWDSSFDGFNRMQLRVYPGDGRTANCVCWHPTNSLFLSATSSTIKMWDTRTKDGRVSFFSPFFEQNNQKKATSTFQFDHQAVKSARDVRFNPFSKDQFAVGFDSGTLDIWDSRYPSCPVIQWAAHDGPQCNILSLDWHPTRQNILASGSMDSRAKVWNVAHIIDARRDNVVATAMHLIQTVRPISRIAWHPSRADWLATTTNVLDKTVSVWDVRSPNVAVRRYGGHENTVADLLWHRWRATGSSGCLITVSKDKYVVVHHPDAAEHPRLELSPCAVEWAPPAHGKLAVAGRAVRRPVGQLHDKSLGGDVWYSIPGQGLRGPTQPLVGFRVFSDHVDSPPAFVTLAKQYRVALGARSRRTRQEKSELDTPQSVCEHNARVAAQAGENASTQCWRVLAALFSATETVQPVKTRSRRSVAEIETKTPAEVLTVAVPEPPQPLAAPSQNVLSLSDDDHLADDDVSTESESEKPAARARRGSAARPRVRPRQRGSRGKKRKSTKHKKKTVGGYETESELETEDESAAFWKENEVLGMGPALSEPGGGQQSDSSIELDVVSVSSGSEHRMMFGGEPIRQPVPFRGVSAHGQPSGESWRGWKQSIDLGGSEASGIENFEDSSALALQATQLAACVVPNSEQSPSCCVLLFFLMILFFIQAVGQF